MEAKSLKEDIEELKESTAKLGKQLSEAVSERWFSGQPLKEMPREFAKNLNRNIQHLQGRINELKQDTVEQTKKVDKTIHNKPYWFLAAAFGVGAVLGTLLHQKSK